MSGSNPGRDKNLFSSPRRLDRVSGPLNLTLCGYWGSFPESERPDCEMNHSLPSSADVKNHWKRTSVSPPPLIFL